MTADAYHQLRLELQGPETWSRSEFVVSDCNREAVRLLDAWPAWPGGALALAGPEGAGKTHLAMTWAERAGAVIPSPRVPADLAGLRGKPVLIENADQSIPDRSLFHLIDMAAQYGGGLLLTARTPPRDWPCALPDLRSRLNALAVASLEAPDDGVLEAMLRRFFRQRHIRPAADVYPYLLRRMERSAPLAREIVRRLDEAAAQEGREVSRLLARRILEDEESL